MEHRDVITRSNPRQAQTDDERGADEMFGLLMALTSSPRAALFARRSDGQLALAMSQGVDGPSLDLARGEWDRRGEAAAGAPWYGNGPECAYLMLPCVDADALAGVLYLELSPKSRRVPAGHLATFSNIFGRALRAQAGLGPPPVAEPEAPVARSVEAARENLILLLERHEWNVSRVSRVLGVTRMTVYNRMRRLRVPRQRLRKSPPRRAR